MNKLNKNQIATIIRNAALNHLQDFSNPEIVEADWPDLCGNLAEACADALTGDQAEDPRVAQRQQITTLLNTLRANEVKTVSQLNLERDAMVALGMVADVKPQTVAAAWKRCIKAIAKSTTTSDGSLSKGVEDVRSGRMRQMDASELDINEAS